MRRVLFHRSWTRFNGGTSGGQLKVRDAYNHIQRSDWFYPAVYFGKETKWFANPGNVWLDLRGSGLKEWSVKNGDILFFAGHDWKIIDPQDRRSPPVPVINIAQPRHIMLPDARKDYLMHPAIRICKSKVGEKILRNYGVNGPIFCIPDAIDFSLLPPSAKDPDIDILIVGLKNPSVANSLLQRMNDYSEQHSLNLKVEAQLPPKLPTRSHFLELLNRSKLAVFLPLDYERGAEGFYLPALEGMALRKLVICPNVIGNMDFCVDNKTCLMPDYDEESIFRAIKFALRMSQDQHARMIDEAYRVAKKHDIGRERDAIINLLHQTDELWNEKSLFRQ